MSSSVVSSSGTATTNYLTVTIAATTDIVNPKVENATTGVSFKYNGTIAAGDSLVVDAYAGSAVLTSTGRSVVPAITRAGAPYFLDLAPGNNTINFTADSGTGSASISHKAARFF